MNNDEIEFSYEDMLNGLTESSIARQLAPDRIQLPGIVRQLLGYMLNERSWVVDGLVTCVVNQDGYVCGIVQSLRNGVPTREVCRFCRVEDLVEQITSIGNRAEFSQPDFDYLLGLPGIRDLRENPGGEVYEVD